MPCFPTSIASPQRCHTPSHPLWKVYLKHSLGFLRDKGLDCTRVSRSKGAVFGNGPCVDGEGKPINSCDHDLQDSPPISNSYNVRWRCLNLAIVGILSQIRSSLDGGQSLMLSLDVLHTSYSTQITWEQLSPGHLADTIQVAIFTRLLASSTL